MDDYPDKTMLSTFELFVALISLAEITDVEMKVGTSALTRPLTLTVEPESSSVQLNMVTSVMILRDNGSLEELPSFIVFDEEEFEV